mgnify:CR=1 FL=1
MQLDNFNLSSGGNMIYTKICGLFIINPIDCSQFSVEMNYECCAVKVDSNNFQCSIINPFQPNDAIRNHV